MCKEKYRNLTKKQKHKRKKTQRHEEAEDTPGIAITKIKKEITINETWEG